jgi:hypothetical protein
MDVPDLISLFAEPLANANVPFLIVGAMAASHYGEPRFTADIDLSVHLSDHLVPSLSRLFPEPDFYCPPQDVILAELHRQERGHFNVIHVPSGLKADFYPDTRNKYFSWAFANARTVTLLSTTVPFAPPEYVILWKLLFFREGQSEKHLRDIQSMLLAQTGKLDEPVLMAMITDHHLEREWKTAASHQT